MTEELLDIVDDDDIVVGQRTRSAVHQLGLQHRGVHVFLFTRDGKLLIQKRSADRSAYPSAWDCSVSEHVKAGEGYLDAALRGMKEEMGVEGIAIEPLILFKMNYGPNDNEISAIYRGVVDPAMVKFDSVEVETIQYFDMNELKNMMGEGREIFCGWFIQMIRWHLNQPSEVKVIKTYSHQHLI